MTAVSHSRLLGALALAAALSGPAWADDATPGALPAIGERAVDDKPLAALAGVDIVEHLGAQLPLATALVDEAGQPLQLGDLFGDGLPVILTFNYSDCPMLCNVMLGGLTKTLTELEWTAGKQFRIVTIALDPKETPAKAAKARRSYLERYGRDAAAGWRFLTAPPATVRALAEKVGFGYRIDEKSGEVFHPAALILASSEGVVSRYIYGVEFDAAELRSALTTTALGGLSESSAKFLHACFSYEQPRSFAIVAMKAMRLAGLGFLALMAGVFAISYVVRSSRASKGHDGSP
jgi:protein SCO1/2